MARGVSSPAPTPLPRVSFVKVSDEVNQKNPGVHDNIAKQYGYNDGSEFQRPEHYIRYIEPLEDDLAVQVEYDMDEQDQEWLDALNTDRKNQQLDKVSYETFEIVMDRLEKEWFDLTKNIPKSDMALPSEDSTCAICDDSEGENTNAIVFCDGCNLAVHQDCYGVPYIPEGQWLCRKCTVSPENPVACILCPNEGGAFKQTVSGEWVHLLCAIWIPETSVANEVFMEPITGVERISKQRWKLRCSVCEVKYGACVQCTKASCFTAFHATCARKEKFLMPMKASQGSEAPTLACYCEKHLPHEQAEAREAMLRAEHHDGAGGDSMHPSSKSNKTARAYNKQYKPGPPLVPRIIVTRILHYISKIHIRHKPEFVNMVCKYWSLKREARRGAPLLKRLHLEPWTASPGSKQQTDEEKALKLDHMKRLRMDLERLRIIADVVQRRERNKRDQADAIQSVLLHFFFPHEGFLRLAFENITSLDRQEYFKSPVSKVEVPDYYDIIKKPMCWDMIDSKLDRHEYLDLAEFKRDIYLVLSNAKTYNQSNTPFYRTAVRIQAAADAELAKLDRLMHHPAPSEPNHTPPEPNTALPEAIPAASNAIPGSPKANPASSEPNPAPSEPNPAPSPVPPPEPFTASKPATPPVLAAEEPAPSDIVPFDGAPSEGVIDLIGGESMDEEKPNIEATPEPVLPDDDRPSIGDLEPPLDILNLLVSEEAIRQDTDLIMTSAPIQSFLSYELPLVRPPAPPPPSLQTPRRMMEKRKDSKPKFDMKAARERKKLERKLALDASPGFRAPRTRAAMAAAAAFEAEATGGASGTETPEAEEPVAGPSSSPQTPASRAPRRGRKSTAERIQEVPTVEDVDSRQSFKMFEVGWILPPEHRRGGRAPLERGPVPPPRKRAKYSHDKSRLSNVSSAPAPSDAQTVSVEGELATGASGADTIGEAGPSHVSESAGETDPPEAPVILVDGEPPGPAEVSLERTSDARERSPVPSGPSSPQPSVRPESAVPEASTEESTERSHPKSELADEPVTVEDAMDTETTDQPQAPDVSEPPSAAARTPSSGFLPAPEVDESPDPQHIRDPSTPVEAEIPAPGQRVTNEVPMEVDEVHNAAIELVEPSAEESLEDSVDPKHEATPDKDATESPAAEESSVEMPGEDTHTAVPEAPVLEQAEDEAKPPQEEPSRAAPLDQEPVPALEQEEQDEDKTPRKIIWIETLDTPAIRREKYQRLKAERQAKREREAAEAAAAERRAKGLPTPEPEPQPVAGPSRTDEAMDVDVDGDSDLTDLSDLESEEGEESVAAPAPAPAPPAPPPVSTRRNRWRAPAPDEPGVINLDPGEKVEGGTLVWAKLDSYPWWPAVVFEDDDAEVPKSVLERCPAPGDNSKVLVRFYEKERKKNKLNNWAWVRLRDLRYLGEDDALDAQMLAPASKYQRWRNNGLRTECRNAYQDALAEMEAEDEAAMRAAQSEVSSEADPLGADSPMTDVED